MDMKNTLLEIQQSECKGYYSLGKGDSTLRFAFQYKPLFIHRLFMRLLLGFKWEDKK